VGTSPSFTLSYVLQVDNNVVPLAPGGTIAFVPPTQLNTTALANLNITNTGSGSGTVTALSLTSGGPVFKLTGTPLLPYTLASGQTLQVGITYSPTAVETDKGAIQITFQDGTTDTVNLSGSGATSTYTYTVLSAGTKTTVKPNGTITLPSVTLATSGTTPATSQVIVTATNSGNANGTINSVNITAPFSLSGLPATPPTLTPGESESFTITYTPTAIGMQTGTLVVGNDTFNLVATGLGPQLTFTYDNGIPVGSGSVVFPLIPVSQSENVSVTVSNTGTSTAAISLISAGPNPPFSVPAVPPSSLAAGQSITFPITFSPTTVGSVSGTLIVNSTSVPLIGAGSAPPSFPSYTLAGPSGDVAPATQQSVSLTLAKSYPVDVSGVLTLTTSGNLGTDPNVQFSSGGRTVAFTIPADSTSADFAGQGSQILLQTGTVAETVTLTPSFTTTAGVNLTPASPSTLEFTIPALAPVLTSLQTTNQSASGFTLLVEGYATTKALDTLLVTFTPAAGYNLAVSQITIDLTQIAPLWFQSASSLSFGGTFEISIPFNLSGSVGKNTTLLQTIASVTATVSNSTGTSNSLELVSP
jgi:hypothetical protein